MTAMLDTVSEISRPADAAQEIARLNNQLARNRTIPPEVVDGLRKFQRWASPREQAQPEGEDARRVRAVARIINQLRFSLTPVGAVEWFSWPRDDLDGRRPLDLLDEP